jgi:hypothetical protein
MDDDSTAWFVIDILILLAFFVDLVLNFITAYYDDDDNIIVNKKKIAFHYFQTWFFLDLCSIVPITIILDSSGDVGSLSTLAKLPRLYRLVKMTRFIFLIFFSFFL